jgi:hypothetical protein
MKQVTKKDEAEVSGGLIQQSTPITWPMPTTPIFPTAPCSPVVNDPLGDGKTGTAR